MNDTLGNVALNYLDPQPGVTPSAFLYNFFCLCRLNHDLSHLLLTAINQRSHLKRNQLLLVPAFLTKPSGSANFWDSRSLQLGGRYGKPVVFPDPPTLNLNGALLRILSHKLWLRFAPNEAGIRQASTLAFWPLFDGLRESAMTCGKKLVSLFAFDRFGIHFRH